MWPHEPGTRCAESEHHLARQRLSGSAGVATVDVSTDGRVVAFVSLARLTAADDNTAEDIYVLDRATGAISLESVPPTGRASDGSSQHPRLSGDGRFLVFSTVATSLTGLDGRGRRLRRCCGAIAPPASRRSCPARRPALRATGGAASRTSATTGASWSSSPTPPTSSPAPTATAAAATSTCSTPPTAGSGDQRHHRRRAARERPERDARDQRHRARRRVLVHGAARRAARSAPRARWTAATVFVRDLADGVTRRISASRDRDGPNGDSYYPAISGDGRRVAFVSTATNLDDDARARRQENIYLHDDRHAPADAAQPERVGRRGRRRQPASRGERRRPLRALQLGRVEPPLHRSLRRRGGPQPGDGRLSAGHRHRRRGARQRRPVRAGAVVERQLGGGVRRDRTGRGVLLPRADRRRRSRPRRRPVRRGAARECRGRGGDRAVRTGTGRPPAR